MNYKMFQNSNPKTEKNLSLFILAALYNLRDQFGYDYVEDPNMLIAFADGDTLKVVPTFLSPAGFTGFCYGTEEEVDNDEVDSDTYLTDFGIMRKVIIEAIKSHGGYTTIEVCGWVDE